VQHQSQKKKLTFLAQGARQRRPDAVIHVGRRRLFAEYFFFGKQKKKFVDEINFFPSMKHIFSIQSLPMEIYYFLHHDKTHSFVVLSCINSSHG
jgi:hypothetical protein